MEGIPHFSSEITRTITKTTRVARFARIRWRTISRKPLSFGSNSTEQPFSPLKQRSVFCEPPSKLNCIEISLMTQMSYKHQVKYSVIILPVDHTSRPWSLSSDLWRFGPGDMIDVGVLVNRFDCLYVTMISCFKPWFCSWAECFASWGKIMSSTGLLTAAVPCGTPWFSWNQAVNQWSNVGVYNSEFDCLRCWLKKYHPAKLLQKKHLMILLDFPWNHTTPN